MEAVKIDIYGNVSEVTDTSLEGLQKAVGGYVQAVYLRVEPFRHEGREYDIMLVDDDGLPKQLEINFDGLTMYKKNTRPNNSLIVGNVVFTTSRVWN